MSFSEHYDVPATGLLRRTQPVMMALVVLLRVISFVSKSLATSTLGWQ
jgi:hypothetical protein